MSISLLMGLTCHWSMGWCWETLSGLMSLDLSEEAGMMQSTTLAWWHEPSWPQCEPLLFLAESLVSAGPAAGRFMVEHEEGPAMGWVVAGLVWTGVFWNDLSSSLRSWIASLTFMSLACWSTSVFSRLLTLFCAALILSMSLRTPSSVSSEHSLVSASARLVYLFLVASTCSSRLWILSSDSSQSSWIAWHCR